MSEFYQGHWGGKAPVAGRKLGAVIPTRKELSLEIEPACKTITVRGVLNDEEVQAVIATAEESGMELQKSRGPRFGEAPRHHMRASFDDPGFAAALWAGGLDEALSRLRVGKRKPVGLNPNIRIYKYVPGDVFGQHVDGSNVVATGCTEYTLLIYLSGAEQGLTGGETAFYENGRELTRVTPVAGSALLHKHGDDSMLHEALPVQSGVKYVLRSDVVFA
mmetsp:Transcript_36661/g.80351  ORF Transcript_36661/g.80351 Transcript_36661/m.80351 type:complete len:219 (-) Transcript_36661:12-668(-)